MSYGPEPKLEPFGVHRGMSVAAGRALVVGSHGGCQGYSTALTEDIALRDKGDHG